MEGKGTSEAELKTHLENIENTLKRIVSYKGVVGYFFIHPDSGRILKSDGFGKNESLVKLYSTKLIGFIDFATSTIRTLDCDDAMTFLRISCGDVDILAAPSPEKKYTLVVVQQVVS
ncbi:unnamed protein product [Phytomonas sp. Hart1]|nr:unnamed protein product [Phytomonas sp. Hart1]|eukprot:CCW72225.1 unnamed protein product [Phytomonas sp. isolate Hart1]